jgi:flagellar motor switch protein FliN/FliY
MDDSPFAQVPIEVTVRVGRARPAVSELLKMQDGAVMALDRRIEDPVELFVGDRLIGRGLLEEVEDEPGRLAVRMTEVVSGAAPK